MSAPAASGLTPQEAALRGASLAFQKQQQQQQQQGGWGGGSNNGSASLSRQTTGSAADSPAERERDRERQALFLPSSSLAPHALSTSAGEHKSASFIAATLAASRSVSPGGRRSDSRARAGTAASRSSPLREDLPSRRSSAVSLEAAEHRQGADTSSLRPATSLIALFDNQGRGRDEVERGDGSPTAPAGRRRQKPRSPQQLPVGPELEAESPDRGGSGSRLSKSSPRPKPKPKPKPKVQASRRDETTPPPVFSRADMEIVSPRPRRPERKPALREDVVLPDELQESGGAGVENALKPKPKVKPKLPKPKPLVIRSENQAISDRDEDQVTSRKEATPAAKTPLTPAKIRPPAPRKSSDLLERLPLEVNIRSPSGRFEVCNTDGQEESKGASAEKRADARPSTADSRSSDDSFVSASSVPTRDETDSILTVRSPTPSAQTTRLRPSRPVSAQPMAPALPMRRSATGSSLQLPLDSLSDAIMAGSLASARHTPVSMTDGRTPPPLPSSRRGTTKQKGPSSRRQSPHRMKHTLRQPPSLSDDETARRPHQHQRRGLNRKKHAHHEGSRSRWREEITEREKKRYEAVWASNRGLLLVPPPAGAPSQHHLSPEDGTRSAPRRQRDERTEVLSELVADVIVRDLWSRSRLPAAELAEVWDLVYGRGRGRGDGGGGGRGVGGALSKQEFVVGMWLIDQRLRGRKIPPWVSESVWDSAKGVRVLGPDHGHGHGHGHGHKGKGR